MQRCSACNFSSNPDNASECLNCGSMALAKIKAAEDQGASSAIGREHGHLRGDAKPDPQRRLEHVMRIEARPAEGGGLSYWLRSLFAQLPWPGKSEVEDSDAPSVVLVV